MSKNVLSELQTIVVCWQTCTKWWKLYIKLVSADNLRENCQKNQSQNLVFLLISQIDILTLAYVLGVPIRSQCGHLRAVPVNCIITTHITKSRNPDVHQNFVWFVSFVMLRILIEILVNIVYYKRIWNLMNCISAHHQLRLTIILLDSYANNLLQCSQYLARTKMSTTCSKASSDLQIDLQSIFQLDLTIFRNCLLM